MKKLLLLGGSAQQVIAIEKAKTLGYETVLCDYLPDNPGRAAADRFYLVSTTDREAVLKVARQEQVQGVVAYASDPAAPTAAYIARELGLSGNPVECVETLCNKDRFRDFLRKNGFHTPVAKGYGCAASALAEKALFRLPVIVKPVDSSGSKGATVLQSWSGFAEALEFAFSFSRCKRVIVEEFIEKKHPYLIGGDIFVCDGEVKLWGLLNCHRDQRVNPLVPVGKSYPLQLEEPDIAGVKTVLQKLIHALGFRNGAMNVELIVDREGRVWPIDIGPRNGGNKIPELLAYIFGVDVVELTLRCAMGEPICLQEAEGKGFYATHNLHADKAGSFAGIRISDRLAPYVLRRSLYMKPGDPVEFFDNAAKALGILFFDFPDMRTQQELLTQIHTHIQIELN